MPCAPNPNPGIRERAMLRTSRGSKDQARKASAGQLGYPADIRSQDRQPLCPSGHLHSASSGSASALHHQLQSGHLLIDVNSIANSTTNFSLPAFQALHRHRCSRRSVTLTGGGGTDVCSIGQTACRLCWSTYFNVNAAPYRCVAVHFEHSLVHLEQTEDVWRFILGINPSGA